MASSSHAEIAGEIEAQIYAGESREEITVEVQRVAREARDYAKSLAPVRTGAYQRSIQVAERGDVKGMPAAQVVATDRKAWWIEYGTQPGEHHAATPAFAVFAKTAQHFSGDTQTGE